MILTAEEALIRVSERVAENKKRIDHSLKQRRNQVVDLYGVEYTRQGGANIPARFYVSISPDMVYLERFEFKLIVNPFMSTSGTIGTASLKLLPDDPDEIKTSITPNPHTHTITSGISEQTSVASNYRVKIEGVDVTPYLMAQYGGAWINGEGVYPSLEIGKDYDILEVASDLVGEGRTADAEKLVRSGYKRIEITANDLFNITLVNYLKLSHSNR